MIVRPAVLADAVAISEVHVKTWQVAYAGLIPLDLLDNLSVEQRAQGWRTHITDGNDVLVVVLDGVVAGFTGFGPSRDDHAAANVGELYAIYVDPGCWDLGVGHALHEAAIAALASAGFGHATLWVLDGNARATGFYERHGWVGDGATKDDVRGDVILHELRFVRPITHDDRFGRL